MAGLETGKIEKFIRRNPLSGEEVHIDEELANLSDSLQLYLSNQQSIRSYPKMHRHVRRELQTSLNHCLSILWRMSRGEKIGYFYNEKSLQACIKEVVRAMVEAVQLTGRSRLIDDKAYRMLYPLMTLSQRRRFQSKQTPILSHLRVLRRRPLPMAA